MAGVVSHMPLALKRQSPAAAGVIAAASDVSLAASSSSGVVVRRRQDVHSRSNVVTGLPLRRNRSCLRLRSQIQLQKASAVQSAVASDLAEEIPMDLQSRGEAEIEHPFANITVGERWREIQGENDWKGLLNPLDLALRSEIIRYGDFTQACYDGFDFDTHSRFCGSCKYNKKRFFQKLGLENRGYEVTDYLYATAGSSISGSRIAKFFKNVDLGDADGNELGDIWDKESNWIGYVAVATDPQEIKRLGRRDILLVWRGTATKLEWIDNMNDFLVPSGLDPRLEGQGGLVDLKVESGFLQLYKSDNESSPYTKKSARQQVLEAVTRLVDKYKDEELSITVSGHSLGSALAMLSAYDLAESGVNHATHLEHSSDIEYKWDNLSPGRDPNKVLELCKSDEVKTVPITVFSFGGPRVGNDAFRDRMEELGVKVLRVVNTNDKIPAMPGLVFNESLEFLEKWMEPLWRLLGKLPWTYTHAGVPLVIDNLVSPYLRRTRDPNNAHNLEGYLHVLDGFHGRDRPFSPTIKRDLALVNKGCDFLHRKFSIPPSWWQEENKGLVRADGVWVPRTREIEDFPEYNIDGASPSSSRFPSVQ